MRPYMSRTRGKFSRVEALETRVHLSVPVPDGYVKVDQMSVGVGGIAVQSRKKLLSGVNYFLRASGTAVIGTGRQLDAEYAERDSGSWWSTSASGYNWNLGVYSSYVSPARTAWAAGSPVGNGHDVDHQYGAYMDGGGTYVQAKFFDDYLSDNSGTLQLEIFAPMAYLSWNRDDNGPDLEAYSFPLIQNPTLASAVSAAASPLGNQYLTVDWGDSLIESGSGIKTHYYEGGDFTIKIKATSSGFDLRTQNVTVADTANPFDPPGSVASEEVTETTSVTQASDGYSYDGGNGPESSGQTPAQEQITPPIRSEAVPLPPVERARVIADSIQEARSSVTQAGHLFVGVFNIDTGVPYQLVVPLPNGGTIKRWYIPRVYQKIGLKNVVQGSAGLVSPGGYNAGRQFVTNVANVRQRVVNDDGAGNLFVTLQDGCILDYDKDRDFGVLYVKRPGDPQVKVTFAQPYKQLGVRGPNGINNEIDRLDGDPLDTLVESKDGTGLQNPKNTQTPQAWAKKQIYAATVARLNTIQASNETFKATGYVGSENTPNIDYIKALRRVRFEVVAANNELVAAVQAEVALLQQAFPGYTFTTIFGN